MKRLKRLWFVWHSWVGLTAGLMLFVVCWSGTFAVLADEVDLLVNPSLQAAHSDTIAWDAAYDAAIVAQPDIADISLQAPAGPGEALLIVGTDEEGDLQRLYADPATGQIIAQTTFFNVQRFFRSFHRNLFLVGVFEFGGAGTGDLIVTAMAIVLLLQLVTSLIFYKRWWRGFWALDWRRGPKVFWSSVHKAGGVCSLWFVTLMAVTGIWYLVEFYLPPPVEDGGKLPVVAADADRRLNIAAAIAAAERAYPGPRRHLGHARPGRGRGERAGRLAVHTRSRGAGADHVRWRAGAGGSAGRRSVGAGALDRDGRSPPLRRFRRAMEPDSMVPVRRPAVRPVADRRLSSCEAAAAARRDSAPDADLPELRRDTRDPGR